MDVLSQDTPFHIEANDRANCWIYKAPAANLENHKTKNVPFPLKGGLAKYTNCAQSIRFFAFPIVSSRRRDRIWKILNRLDRDVQRYDFVSFC